MRETFSRCTDIFAHAQVFFFRRLGFAKRKGRKDEHEDDEETQLSRHEIAPGV